MKLSYKDHWWTKCVYALLKDGVVFYVGVTKGIYQRYYQHRAKHGSDIEILILDEIKTNKRIGKKDFELETFWIYQMKAWGFPLINKIYSNKGRGGNKAKQTKQQLS